MFAELEWRLPFEPMKDAFFKLAEPELNFYWNEAIDIGHVTGGKNDSQ